MTEHTVELLEQVRALLEGQELVEMKANRKVLQMLQDAVDAFDEAYDKAMSEIHRMQGRSPEQLATLKAVKDILGLEIEDHKRRRARIKL